MVEETKGQRIDSEEQQSLIRQEQAQKAKARDEYEQLMLNSSFDEAYKKKPIVKSTSSSKLNTGTAERRMSGKIKKTQVESQGLTNIGSSGGTIVNRQSSEINQSQNLKKSQVFDKLPFKRYQIFAFANPKSGDGLAAGFLTDFPSKNQKTLWFEEHEQTVECLLNFYDVLERIERERCLEDLAIAIRENEPSTRKIVVIMGGDGSLATTITFLRTSVDVDQGLSKGKISFVMLPFGTGNDGAQVFGWGNSPSSELWLQDIESLMRDIVKSQVQNLSLWNCEVDGEVYSAGGEKLAQKLLMVYYFNLGADTTIGLEVERKRTKRRCCNYILYGLFACKTFLYSEGKVSDIRTQVKRIFSRRKLANGYLQDKVVANIEQIESQPFNVVGYNLNSGMGNLVFEKTWEKSAKKIADPRQALRQHRMNISMTSCDESDSKLVQKIDDDKIELMCCQQLTDYVDGSLGRLGQVRSPFHIELLQEFEKHDRKMGLGLDGEFYELQQAKSITFTIDKDCPKIKILKRQGYVNPSEKNQQILTELKNDFQPTIF